MPAMMDDPSAATIYRTSGEPPYPEPGNPTLPAGVQMYEVTLRDRQTVATIVPFASYHQVPRSLLEYLSDQLNKEIEGGDTYPMMETMSADRFARYWFQNFGAIMLLGSIDDIARFDRDDWDWVTPCLGSFYIKPNYPGRSSHVCNAGFLVTDASRNRGVGRLMGEAYLEWAPKLGYTYSVFNLVYETNVASCRIWDALGFKRIGRVKGCGNLKSYPGRYIDALIYGRDLVGPDAEGLQPEDRFDKIKFYLKWNKYPPGADRAEKSRLRAAATHYKLVEGDILMHGDKEVISDPLKQFQIALKVHEAAQHAGINRTTTAIRESYHWRSIKDTATEAIKKCEKCIKWRKAQSHLLNRGPGSSASGSASPSAGEREEDKVVNEANKGPEKPGGEELAASDEDPLTSSRADPLLHTDPYETADMAASLSSSDPMAQDPPISSIMGHEPISHGTISHSHLQHTTLPSSALLETHESQYPPIDLRLISGGVGPHHYDPSAHYTETTSFQALLNDSDEDAHEATVDRDMAMFVKQHGDDGEYHDGNGDHVMEDMPADDIIPVKSDVDKKDTNMFEFVKDET